MSIEVVWCLLAANVRALAMWRNLKNVCPQPMLNKITKDEDKNHS
jgi:thermostable 8-oxoguanine DNA glycosylase